MSERPWKHVQRLLTEAGGDLSDDPLDALERRYRAVVDGDRTEVDLTWRRMVSSMDEDEIEGYIEGLESGSGRTHMVGGTTEWEQIEPFVTIPTSITKPAWSLRKGMNVHPGSRTLAAPRVVVYLLARGLKNIFGAYSWVVSSGTSKNETHEYVFDTLARTAGALVKRMTAAVRKRIHGPSQIQLGPIDAYLLWVVGQRGVTSPHSMSQRTPALPRVQEELLQNVTDGLLEGDVTISEDDPRFVKAFRQAETRPTYIKIARFIQSKGGRASPEEIGAMLDPHYAERVRRWREGEKTGPGPSGQHTWFNGIAPKPPWKEQLSRMATAGKLVRNGDGTYSVGPELILPDGAKSEQVGLDEGPINDAGLEANVREDFLNNTPRITVFITRGDSREGIVQALPFDEFPSRPGKEGHAGPTVWLVSLSNIYDPGLRGKGIGMEAYMLLRDHLTSRYDAMLASDTARSASADKLWQTLVKSGEAKFVPPKTKLPGGAQLDLGFYLMKRVRR